MTDACFEIDRAATNNSGYLYIDQFTITGLTAPTMDMANSEIANLSLSGSTDGHTMSATLDNAVSEQVILSVRDTGDFQAEDSVVDRVVIHTLGDATVGQLIVNGFSCSVSAPVTNNASTGAVDFDYMKVGNFTLDSTSKIGDGDGIDAADMIINSTVSARSVTALAILERNPDIIANAITLIDTVQEVSKDGKFTRAEHNQLTKEFWKLVKSINNG